MTARRLALIAVAAVGGLGLAAALTAGDRSGGGAFAPAAGPVTPPTVPPSAPNPTTVVVGLAAAAAPAPPLAAPAGVEDGVPVGYPQNEAGAAGAATGYLTAVQGLLFADPTVRDTALRRIAAPESPEVVAGMLDGLAAHDRILAAARQRDPQAEAFVREAPVAYTVTAFDKDAATVEVWSVTVGAVDATALPVSSWGTTTVELTWDSDGWRVTHWVKSPGPTPAAGLEPATSLDGFLRRIDGWKGYAYVPAT
jgi:hypothetical protein